MQILFCLVLKTVMPHGSGVGTMTEIRIRENGKKEENTFFKENDKHDVVPEWIVGMIPRSLTEISYLHHSWPGLIWTFDNLEKQWNSTVAWCKKKSKTMLATQVPQHAPPWWVSLLLTAADLQKSTSASLNVIYLSVSAIPEETYGKKNKTNITFLKVFSFVPWSQI